MRAIRLLFPLTFVALLSAMLGYYLAGATGFFLGLGLSYLVRICWMEFRLRRHINRPEFQMELERIASTYNRSAGHSSEGWPPVRTMSWVITVYGLFLLFYNVVFLGARHSGVLAGWMVNLQDLIDWLSPAVPVLRKIPPTLIAEGYADWVQAAQHVLLVNWIATIPVMIWIFLDVFFRSPRTWARIFSAARPQLCIRIATASTFLALSFLVLFFGRALAWVWLNGLAVIHLPALFFLQMLIFGALVNWCNAFVRQPVSLNEYGEREQKKVIHRELTKLLRRDSDGA